MNGPGMNGPGMNGPGMSGPGMSGPGMGGPGMSMGYPSGMNASNQRKSLDPDSMPNPIQVKDIKPSTHMQHNYIQGYPQMMRLH